MSWRDEWRWLVLLAGGLLTAFYLPVGTTRFDGAVLEAFHLVRSRRVSRRGIHRDAEPGVFRPRERRYEIRWPV